MKKLLILGAGGYGRTVYELARILGEFDKIAFLDDRSTGANVLGTCAEFAVFADENTWMYPAFGNNEIRCRWMEQLEEEQIPVPTLIHPRAYVSPSAEIGPGTVVLAMAAVNTGACLGSGCIVNIGALIDHDVVLGDFAHVAPGGIIKAENRIPSGMKVESGDVIQNRTYPL